MRISAKSDYAVRAALELAAAERPPLKAERIADAQAIPLKFLENILGDLRQAGLVVSQRGSALDAAIDVVRDRFGADAITRGVLIGRDQGLSVPLLPD